MRPRLDSLDGSVLTFAHRGASAHAPENTEEAFRLAVELGALGVESDAWVSADGHAILDHDGRVGSRFRRRPIGELHRAELPDQLCTIEDLYRVVGPGTAVSIDLKDPGAFEPVLASARARDAEQGLWLCHPDLETLTELRRRTDAKLVLSTRLRSLDGSPERSVAQLRERGIDALNLPHAEWHGGLIALAHRFERYALGWGLEHEREMAKIVNDGIDGMFSNHVDRMVAVLAQFT